ncbi:hypothetical protein LAZ67_X004007, partial [Cordylochernes scorpioides]
MEEMDAIKKRRKAIRGTFTRIINEINGEFEKSQIDRNDIYSKFNRLESYYTKLVDLNEKYQALLVVKEGITEESIDREWQECDKYEEEKFDIQQKVSVLRNPDKEETIPIASEDTVINVKLPELALKTYDGSLEGWLPWWAQFSKIHENKNLSDSDRFLYLRQAIVPNSEAYRVVASYPVTGANYALAVQALQERFGDPNILTELYVRRLLNSVISNVKKENRNLSSLYDELSSHLRSLETLGIDPQLSGIFLYPLVESSLPSDILKIWHRHPSSGYGLELAKREESDKGVGGAQERLRLLLDFLKAEKGTHTESVPRTIGVQNCGRNHLEVLCEGNSSNRLTKPGRENLKENAHEPIASLSSQACTGQVLLMTTVALLRGPNASRRVRILLDSGSQFSYIKQSLVWSIGIERKGEITIAKSIFGGNKIGEEKHGKFMLELENLGNKRDVIHIEALDQRKICDAIPPLPKGDWLEKLKIKGIILSQDNFKGQEIDILIGANYLGMILTGKIVQVEADLTAVETKLGWTLMGNSPIIDSNDNVQQTLNLLTTRCDLKDLWDLEVLGIRDPVETCSKETRYQEIKEKFITKIQRQSDQRYSVGLPWKVEKESIPSNLDIAIKRLDISTKKMTSQNKLTEYSQIFRDWLTEGLIERVEENPLERRGYYLPHRTVYKMESKTTPIRPVFDASCLGHNGLSLNQCLEKGPNLLERIPEMMIRFRENKFGVTADIRKAFQMVAIEESERNYLRFLWWEKESDRELIAYRHKRLVFGLNCSPFVLNAVIEYHLQSIRGPLVQWANILAQSFYMDNCITSLETKQEVQEFQKAAIEIMDRAKMDLREWEYSLEENPEKGTCTKILGVVWNKMEDSLKCELPDNLSLQPKLTKRLVLSMVQRIFDPLGFCAPVFLPPKLLLQRSWGLKLGWDTPLPESMAQEFRTWMDQIKLIELIKIPRYMWNDLIFPTEVHIFCDASQIGYGAVAYLRSETGRENTLTLIWSKVRLAPMKSITIPRLELMAMVLGARLANAIQAALKRKCETTLWSDSTTALSWIKREIEWRVFVRNRVREIQATTNLNDWRFVPSQLNPADLLSRGCPPSQFVQSRWWEGPEWLKKPKEFWPNSEFSINPKEINVEENIMKTNINLNIDYKDWILTRRSNYSLNIRLVRSSGPGGADAPEEYPTSSVLWTERRLRSILQAASCGRKERLGVSHKQRLVDGKDVLEMADQPVSSAELKKLRTPVRARFTKAFNELETEIKKNEVKKADVEKILRRLQTHHEKLSILNMRMEEALLRESASEDIFTAEYESVCEYEDNFSNIMTDYEALAEKDDVSTISGTAAMNYQLPKLEFKKFGGEPREWITFWSQFSTIDPDPQMPPETKFQYLFQATAENSEVREAVESFLPSADNYPKVIEYIKSRFGEDEMLVEIYVRDLLQNVRAEGKMSVVKLYDRLETQLRALETLGVARDKFAAMLYPLVESALPEDTLRVWERSQYTKNTGSKMPTATDLANTTQMRNNCIFCGNGHPSQECYSGQRMHLPEKKDKAKWKNVCFWCLLPGHGFKKCRIKPRCPVCGGKHYPIMCPTLEAQKTSHFQKAELKVSRESPATKQETANQFTSKTLNNATVGGVYLQTLIVKISGPKGKHNVRVLLDCGSQRSYISKRMVDALGLKRVQQAILTHNLFGGGEIRQKKHNVYKVNVSSLNNEYMDDLKFLDQEVICGHISQVQDHTILNELKARGINLTDICQGEEISIHMLIGSDLLSSILTGRMQIFQNGVVATETKLGWTVMGPAIGKDMEDSCLIVTSFHSNSFDVQDLWKLDVLGIMDAAETKSKKDLIEASNTHFKETVKRDESGRYIVSLPWIAGHPPVPVNRRTTENRLLTTTRNVQGKMLYEKYDTIFEEWEKERFIEEVEDKWEECSYLPHRPVLKDSHTTPIRPVFDASCKKKGLPSLNQCLEKGDNLIELIPDLLLRFRLGKYGIIADMRKAFLQIQVREEDREFLRFLWWKKDQKTLKFYRHCRVVFGLTSSPFLLAATIKYHLSLPQFQDNRCAELLARSFYVDNCILSLSSTHDVKIFIKESSDIMMQAKFELRDWMWNEPGITEQDPASILGMKWHLQTDTIAINVQSLKNIDEEKSITKRSILSACHRIFDPIQFTCPATIKIKKMVQDAWKENKSWDEPLNEDRRVEFIKWRKQALELDQIKIPRWILPIKGRTTLHVFCDASAIAYATVIFMRIENASVIVVRFVEARNRLATIKRITIPRLELLACLIGARLLVHVLENLEESPEKIQCWTDSSPALYWIQQQENWAQFVSNRVKEITTLTKREDWNHVAGEHNPADLPSRGESPSKFTKSGWWEGPKWLQEKKENWPVSKVQYDLEAIEEERRKTVVAGFVAKKPEENPWYLNLYEGKHEVTLTQILRVIAWMLRFKPSEYKGDIILQEELDSAEKSLVKIIQKLIVKSVHEKMYHCGAQTLRSVLREKFWIPKARQLVRHVIHKCPRCRRFETKRVDVPEASLPQHRVRDVVVFEVTGIDLGGPLYLEDGQKVWFVIFTCGVYRAVHLELVTSLSTEALVGAVERFVARRGCPAVIYSDNGTNLVGLRNELYRVNFGVKWKLNPPAAPWWGGWIERIVGLTKKLLRRLLGKRVVNYEEMVTILENCERVISARPLTYIAEDNDDLVPLTPEMFFREPRAEGEIDLNEFRCNFGKSYEKRKRLLKEFRKRFRSEYLGLLVHHDNRKKQRQLKVGDIVLVEVENRKQINWPMGKITKVFPGTDNVRRLVEVKTKSGFMKRAVQRLFPLEVPSEDVEQGDGELKPAEDEIVREKTSGVESASVQEKTTPVK